MEKEHKKQNIILVVLAIVHVLIIVFCYVIQSNITEFIPLLDDFPKRGYLAYGMSLTPILVGIIFWGYFFKHRQKLTKKDVIEKWIRMFPWMIALSIVFFLVSVFPDMTRYDLM